MSRILSRSIRLVLGVIAMFLFLIGFTAAWLLIEGTDYVLSDGPPAE